MAGISIRFYGALNDFLQPRQREQTLHLPLGRRTSVKDLIESRNVPHTEIEAIHINNKAVGLNHIVAGHDHIEAYAEAPDAVVSIPLRPAPPSPPRFVIDCNLGRLTRYLRLLGFDALYANDYTDQTVARLAADQDRIVLTRDRFLLQHRIITWGYFVRQVDPLSQLKETMARFELQAKVHPFTRCTACNGELQEVEKNAIVHRLEPKTIRYFDHFKHCPDCDRLYWPGSHYQRALRLVKEVTGDPFCRTPDNGPSR